MKHVLIQDLKKYQTFYFNDKKYVVKQKYSNWKRDGEEYLKTECGEIFYYGGLVVNVKF